MRTYSSAFTADCPTSFLSAAGVDQRTSYAYAVLDTIRSLHRNWVAVQGPHGTPATTLYLDEDSFLALEFWHHRFAAWPVYELRQLDHRGGAVLDFGFGPLTLVVLPAKQLPVPRQLEIGGLSERDTALLTYVTSA